MDGVARKLTFSGCCRGGRGGRPLEAAATIPSVEVRGIGLSRERSMGTPDTKEEVCLVWSALSPTASVVAEIGIADVF